MTDEKPAASISSTSAISLGMSCSVMSMCIHLYSAFDIFHWMPKALDVLLAVKVRTHFSTEFIGRYGVALWVLVAVAIALSVWEAFRRPGQPRTVRIQVVVFASAALLAMMARHAMWYPFISLMQGVGT